MVMFIVAWIWVGIKTTSFILTDLTDNADEKTVIVASCIAGIVWPLVYGILLSFLIFEAIYGENLAEALNTIRNRWKKK